MAVLEATSAPLRRSVTFHGMPLRFWSTSNSTSMPRSSFLSLSFDVELLLQTPADRDAVAALGEAIGAVVRAAPATARAAATGMMRRLEHRRSSSSGTDAQTRNRLVAAAMRHWSQVDPRTPAERR